jgi:hypothetical protein
MWTITCKSMSGKTLRMIYKTSNKKYRLLKYSKQLGSFWREIKLFAIGGKLNMTKEHLTSAISPGDIKLGASSEREKRQSRCLHVPFVHMHRPCALEARKAVRQVRHRGLPGPEKQRHQSTGIDQEPRISRSRGRRSKNNPEEQGAGEARIPRKQRGNVVGSFLGGKKRRSNHPGDKIIIKKLLRDWIRQIN